VRKRIDIQMTSNPPAYLGQEQTLPGHSRDSSDQAIKSVYRLTPGRSKTLYPHTMKTTQLLTCLFTVASISTTSIRAAQPPDLSRLVFIGDSLLAGFRTSSLRSDWQANGIAAVIARQAGVPLAQPLIAAPGMPNPLEQVDPQNPLAITRTAGVSSGRVDVTAQPFNLAVPGHTVGDALGRRPDLPVDSLTDLVLGLPGLYAGQVKSQVEWAEALKPTTIIAWIGNNDLLNAALAGDLSAMTDEATFTKNFSAFMDRLAATGARLFVANLPDVDTIPFVVPVPALGRLLGVPLPSVLAALGVTPADFLTLDHIPDAIAVLQSNKAGPLTDPEVLDAGEVAGIRAATAKYNDFIAAKCAEKGAQLVDMNAFLKRLVALRRRHARTASSSAGAQPHARARRCAKQQHRRCRRRP
jgi:hypothetical protein